MYNLQDNFVVSVDINELHNSPNKPDATDNETNKEPSVEALIFIDISGDIMFKFLTINGMFCLLRDFFLTNLITLFGIASTFVRVLKRENIETDDEDAIKDE